LERQHTNLSSWRNSYYEINHSLDKLYVELQKTFIARHVVKTYSSHNVNVIVDHLS